VRQIIHHLLGIGNFSRSSLGGVALRSLAVRDGLRNKTMIIIDPLMYKVVSSNTALNYKDNTNENKSFLIPVKASTLSN
jgi:hypothetical protein